MVNDIKKNIIDLTREEILQIPKRYRYDIIKQRHEWIKKAREIDKEYAKKESIKIYNFQNRERIHYYNSKPENKKRRRKLYLINIKNKKLEWETKNPDFVNIINFAKSNKRLRMNRSHFTPHEKILSNQKSKRNQYYKNITQSRKKAREWYQNISEEHKEQIRKKQRERYYKMKQDREKNNERILKPNQKK